MPDDRLHDVDFYTWTKVQAAALRDIAQGRRSNAVDWENVIEEIESLGSVQEHALVSHLVNIIVHLLKLELSPAENPRKHWRQEIGHQRVRFERRLKKNPGLKSSLGLLFAEAYEDARRDAAISMEQDGLSLKDIPEACPYTLDQIRDFDWFPVCPADGAKD
ncbi:MAG: hypothetical protein RLY86_2282 [Pseudomonadota bacterium]|jgi:hypothetical protein